MGMPLRRLPLRPDGSILQGPAVRPLEKREVQSP